MTLNLSEVDIRASMEAAAEGVQDRLVKNRITLDIRSPANIGSFAPTTPLAPGPVQSALQRGRLLAAAEPYSGAERRPEAVVFTVTDHGPGIPPKQKTSLRMVRNGFLRLPHRGPGLGLSLVRSFVELHGGRVQIDSRRPHDRDLRIGGETDGWPDSSQKIDYARVSTCRVNIYASPEFAACQTTIRNRAPRVGVAPVSPGFSTLSDRSLSPAPMPKSSMPAHLMPTPHGLEDAVDRGR